MTIKNNTGVNISEDIALIFSVGGMYMCMTSFTVHYKRWLRLCTNVLDFSQFGEPATFETVKKKTNIVTASMSFYSLIAVFFYLLRSFLSKPACEAMNLEKNLHEICAFGPIWLPVEKLDTFTWWLVNIVIVYDTLNVIMSEVAVFFLIYGLTLTIISHVDHFKNLFLEALEEEHVLLKKKKLRDCVNYHKYIIDLGNELSYLTKITVGGVCLSSAICIGCIANQSLKEQSIRGFMVLFGFCAGYFVLCHSGQIITDETLSLKDMVYSSKWYLCDSSTMKDIRFILARSQIPIVLDTIPFGHLSYPLYLMIIKTSYSYVTLLSHAT